MAFEPNKITKEHIIEAAKIIDSGQYNANKSTGYDVVIEGKKYPPKEVIRVAHHLINGQYLSPSGGEPTNKILRNLGFLTVEKQDPLNRLIKNYKDIVKNGNPEEIYKWDLLGQYKGRPDIEASDFTKEIDTIDFRNLIYAIGLGVIKQLGREKPEEFRACFKFLFDEVLPLDKRTKDFPLKTIALYRDIVTDSHLGDHQDERTMATYLTYYNPEKYTFYKNSFYKKFCKVVGIKPAKKGEKYVHYLTLIKNFIEDYIIGDDELIKLKNNFLAQSSFKDPNHLILAQDILYQTLDKQNDTTESERSYYIIGSKYGEGNNVDIFPKMVERSVVCTGFAWNHDLSEFENEDEDQITSYLQSRGEEPKSYNAMKHFMNIKPNDWIAIKSDGSPKGNKPYLCIVGIAEVVEKEGKVYEHAPNGLGHILHVKFIKAPVRKEFEIGGYGATIHKLSDQNVIKTIFDINQYSVEKRMSLSIHKNAVPLNQILFGPPGTGKTYHTINKAVAICDDLTEKQLSNIADNRDMLKGRFEELLITNWSNCNGQIGFTTFHQSLSYEDFIEGIKPQGDGEGLSYKVEEGIFLKMCIEASFSLAKQNDNKQTEDVLDFSQAFDNYVQFLSEQLSKGDLVELETRNGGKVIVDGISQHGNIIIKHQGSTNTYPVSKQRLSKLHQAFSDLNQVNNIDTEFRAVIGGSNATAGWAVLNAIRKHKNWKSPVPQELNYSWEDKVAAVRAMKKHDFIEKEGKRFVLIIDEINRANVSQVFGELITLLEPDKRAGRKEALEVVLPYSKERFFVPPNLYILGTMNTADRSVEALDTALRRRFSFEFMPPNPDAIKHEDGTYIEVGGLVLKNLIEVINERLSYLLDEDHQIGHSYLMEVKDEKDLKAVFKNKIIPLLKEYFYNDHGKIRLILGDAFVKVTSEKPKFAVNDDDTEDFISDKSTFTFESIDDDFDIVDALKKALGK